MLRKKSWIIVGLMLMLVMLAGCASSGKQQSGQNSQKEQASQSATNKPIRLGVLPIEDNLPLYVAESDKLFEKAGIKVELVPFASALERDAALQAGRIDGEVADLVAVGLLKKGGTDVKVASIGLGATPQEGRFALLLSPKSTAKVPADLKNVPIAVSQNTIIEFVTDMLLRDAGLAQGEIKKVSIPKIPVRLQMLASGELQAAVLPDPLATLAEKQGAKVLLDDTKLTKNLTQTVILFSQSAISDNKEAIRKVVEIYGTAGKAMTDNPEKYRPLLIEKAKIPAPIKDTYKSPTFTKPQLPKVEDIDRVMNWMVEKKLLDKAYTYNELVDSNLL